MIGQNHSLITLLRRTWPHIVPIKCVCHSLDLIAKHAVKSTIPSHIDYLVRESYNWFAHSAQRRSAYQEIANLIGFSTRFDEDEIDGGSTEEDADANEKHLPKLLSPSDTRWLVLADCVEKILAQFSALKAHFNIAYTREKCYQAKVLFEMYSDEKNYLYLLLIFPILKELSRLTKLFQSNSLDILRVYIDLEAAFLSLGRRILKPAIIGANTTVSLAELNLETEFCLLEPESVDLGSAFLRQLENSSLSGSEKFDIKIRGKSFLKDIFVGFQKRLSGSLHLLKKIDCFTFENVKIKPLSVEHFMPPFFPQDKPLLAEIEAKSKLLQASGLTANDTESFWSLVHHYQDANGSFPFRQLSAGSTKYI